MDSDRAGVVGAAHVQLDALLGRISDLDCVEVGNNNKSAFLSFEFFFVVCGMRSHIRNSRSWSTRHRGPDKRPESQVASIFDEVHQTHLDEKTTNNQGNPMQ